MYIENTDDLYLCFTEQLPYLSIFKLSKLYYVAFIKTSLRYQRHKE